MSADSRKRRHRQIGLQLTAALAISAAAACSRVPSYVIEPDDMALLLADIHTGEGVVDQNYSSFRTDSAKLALKAGIYKRHGVTQEQVDTSLMWYGHNLELYGEVYDKTIEILEKRLSEIRSTAASAAMAVAGDSVDVWNGAKHLTVAGTSPSEFLTFALDYDENWEPGDVYSWKFKTLNNSGNLTMSVFVDYADGVTEQSYSTTSADGWHTVQLTTDTLREARRIYGVSRLSIPHRGGFMYLDSISLTRNRKNPAAYAQRFRQRKYGEPRKTEKDAEINKNPEPPRAFKAEGLKISDN